MWHQEIYSQFTISDGVLVGNEEECSHWPIGNYILKKLTSHPDLVGLVNAQTHDEVTYQEMLEKSVMCAAWLKKRNVLPGDIITVFSSNTIDLYVPFLAGLYIGAVVNMWDVNCKLNLDVLRRIRPKVVFMDKKYVLEMFGLLALLYRETYCEPTIVMFQPQQHFISLKTIFDWLEDYNIQHFLLLNTVRYVDIMVILHTTNMMTVEKSIMISHEAFQNSFILELPPMTPNDYGLWYANLGCYFNIVLLVKAIILQVPLVVWWKKDYKQLCNMIANYQVQWTYFTNLQAREFNYFIKNSSDSTDSFRDEGIGINTVEEFDHVERDVPARPIAFLSSLKYILHDLNIEYPNIHDNLITNLGEETNIILLYSYPESGVIASRWCLEKRCNAGFVCKNVEVKVINLIASKARPNEEGEICCRSPYMMTGYHLQPTLTQSAIDKEGWLHTKDMGCYCRDGFIFVKGNAHLPITYKGESREVLCVEYCLETFNEGVSNACVLPLLHEIDDEHPFAFLVREKYYRSNGEPLRKEEVNVAEALEDVFGWDNSCQFRMMFLLAMPMYTEYDSRNIKRLYHILVKYLQNNSLCYK